MSHRNVSLTLLLAVMLTVSLLGCNVARLTINTPLTSDSVAFITEGQTTLADVVDKLGAPDSITDAEEAPS